MQSWRYLHSVLSWGFRKCLTWQVKILWDVVFLAFSYQESNTLIPKLYETGKCYSLDNTFFWMQKNVPQACIDFGFIKAQLELSGMLLETVLQFLTHYNPLFLNEANFYSPSLMTEVNPLHCNNVLHIFIFIYFEIVQYLHTVSPYCVVFFKYYGISLQKWTTGKSSTGAQNPGLPVPGFNYIPCTRGTRKHQ